MINLLNSIINAPASWVPQQSGSENNNKVNSCFEKIKNVYLDSPHAYALLLKNLRTKKIERETSNLFDFKYLEERGLINSIGKISSLVLNCLEVFNFSRTQLNAESNNRAGRGTPQRNSKESFEYKSRGPFFDDHKHRVASDELSISFRKKDYSKISQDDEGIAAEDDQDVNETSKISQDDWDVHGGNMNRRVSQDDWDVHGENENTNISLDDSNEHEISNNEEIVKDSRVSHNEEIENDVSKSEKSEDDWDVHGS